MTLTKNKNLTLDELKNRLELVLQKLLQQQPSQLNEAMRYSALGGGKRVRGLFTYCTGLALGADVTALDKPAAAIELIHAYSLVHDDLPAMDNADLRRGKPSCHKAFDEATAILVGDALQTLAFEYLSHANSELTPKQQLDIIRLIAEASGAAGMAGGQMLDILATKKSLDFNALTVMHALKTGALIRASILAGAIAAKASAENFILLHDFADTIGLLFQVKDDLLDAESDTQTLGKTSGIDTANQKTTVVTTLGLENTKKFADELLSKANHCLEQLPCDTSQLLALSQNVLTRVK